MFLGLYTALILTGVLTVLWPRAPLFFLLWLPNVIGGMLLPIILVLMLQPVNSKRLMGEHINGPIRNVVAGVTTAVLVVLTGVWLVLTIADTVH